MQTKVRLLSADHVSDVPQRVPFLLLQLFLLLLSTHTHYSLHRWKHTRLSSLTTNEHQLVQEHSNDLTSMTQTHMYHLERWFVFGFFWGGGLTCCNKHRCEAVSWTRCFLRSRCVKLTACRNNQPRSRLAHGICAEVQKKQHMIWVNEVTV